MKTKLVPIEPTPEMVSAGYAKLTTNIESNGNDMYPAYRAMIDAAPDTPPEGMMNGFVPVGWGIFDGNGKLSSFTHGKEGADAIASEYSDGDYYVARLYA